MSMAGMFRFNSDTDKCESQALKAWFGPRFAKGADATPAERLPEGGDIGELDPIKVARKVQVEEFDKMTARLFK